MTTALNACTVDEETRQDPIAIEKFVAVTA